MVGQAPGNASGPHTGPAGPLKARFGRNLILTPGGNPGAIPPPPRGKDASCWDIGEAEVRSATGLIDLLLTRCPRAPTVSSFPDPRH